MDIRGEYRLNAPRQAVWQALNDPAVLRECIPGCQKLERISDTQIEATIAAQIGPVKAPFGTRIVRVLGRDVFIRRTKDLLVDTMAGKTILLLGKLKLGHGAATEKGAQKGDGEYSFH